MTKGEETRSSVLGSAIALASTHGLDGVTIGKLADHVGMSKSGLFAHFSSKENLQLALLEEAIERFIALVVTPALAQPRGEPRVRALLDRWLDWTKASFLPGGCIFVVAMVELDDRPGAPRDRVMRSQREWLATLTRAAEIAVREGHFRADLDGAQLAHEAYALALGYHFLRRLQPADEADRRVRAGFDRLLADARRPS